MSADSSKGSSLSSLSGLAALSSSRSSQASISARRGSSGLLSCPVIIGSWRRVEEGPGREDNEGGKGKRSDVSFGVHWFTYSGSQAHACPLISSLSLSLCFLKLTTSSNTLYGSACSLSLSVSLFSDGCCCWL